MAAPPVINGFIFTEQTVAPGQTIDPFSKVSISDSVLDADRFGHDLVDHQ